MTHIDHFMILLIIYYLHADAGRLCNLSRCHGLGRVEVSLNSFLCGEANIHRSQQPAIGEILQPRIARTNDRKNSKIIEFDGLTSVFKVYQLKKCNYHDVVALVGLRYSEVAGQPGAHIRLRCSFTTMSRSFAAAHTENQPSEKFKNLCV